MTDVYFYGIRKETVVCPLLSQIREMLVCVKVSEWIL